MEVTPVQEISLAEEQSLLKKVKKGNKAALETLCSYTWQDIYKFVFFKTKDTHLAEEITQDTYCRAVSSMARYTIRDTRFKSYLMTIANNLIIDGYRKKKITVMGHEEVLKYIPDLKKGPEAFYMLEEKKQEIRHCLQQLSDEQQQIISYRLLEGYSVRETSQMMGKSESAVRTAQHRAVVQLKELMRKEGIV